MLDSKTTLGEKLKEEADETSSLSTFYVKISDFEGPFDLLLHLIDEGKIPIYNVSLRDITEAYLNYIKGIQEPDISIASEFLIMAAYLMEAKSRSLLPQELIPPEEGKEEVQQIEKSLLEHMLEYKTFKALAQNLRQRKEIFEKCFPRHLLEEVSEKEIFLVDVSLRDLISAFQKIWELSEARGNVEEIPDEYITVSQKITEISNKVNMNPEGILFEKLFTRLIRIEIIVTFLAILELARQKMILIKQGDNFGSILICRRN